VFVIGTGNKPAVSLPKGKGIKVSSSSSSSSSSRSQHYCSDMTRTLYSFQLCLDHV